MHRTKTHETHETPRLPHALRRFAPRVARLQRESRRLRDLHSAPPQRALTPPLRVLPKLEPAANAQPASSSAGLIVVTGPPLSGKQALGHFLHEYLPDSIHVSQVDPLVAELTDEDPEPLRALLRRLRSELRCGHEVVFSARLESPAQRRRVLDVAREVGVPRLLVEVEGTDPATLERASEVAEAIDRLSALLEELRQALPHYRAITAREQDRLPTITVTAQQSVEEQVKVVLDGWGKLGSVC